MQRCALPNGRSRIGATACGPSDWRRSAIQNSLRAPFPVRSVFPSAGPVSTRDQLLAALRTQRLLIVLDNCEHLIAEAAAIADAIRQSCPSVSILATSRERLNVRGERIYLTPALQAPPRDDALGLTPNVDAASAMTYPAVALFVDSAQSVADFRLRDEEATVVSEICRRLDGIPLAIELAAARLLVMQPAELLRGLDERFRILRNGHRADLPRQQTMRAAIDWSHDLLSTSERILFRRLGIFAGSWTKAAAEAVCGVSGLEADEVL